LVCWFVWLKLIASRHVCMSHTSRHLDCTAVFRLAQADDSLVSLRIFFFFIAQLPRDIMMLCFFRPPEGGSTLHTGVGQLDNYWNHRGLRSLVGCHSVFLCQATLVAFSNTVRALVTSSSVGYTDLQVVRHANQGAQ
jgi:hypothetical protein